MKTRLLLLALALLGCSPVAAQTQSILDLPSGSSPSSSNLLIIGQNGSLLNITFAQLQNALIGPGTVNIETGAEIIVYTGKTATFNNTLTFSGTDGSTLNIGAGGTLGSAAYTSSSNYQAALTFGPGITYTSNQASLSAPTSTNLGGIYSATSTSNEWVTHIDSTGAQYLAQPAFPQIGGLIEMAQIDTTNTVSGDVYESTGTGGWIAVQLGSASTLSSAAFLQTTNNGSDIANAATFRANLGLNTLASASLAPSTNQVVYWNGSAWTTGALPGFAAVTKIIDSTGLLNFGTGSGIVTVQLNNGVNGPSGLVQFDSSTDYPAGNGSAITGITSQLITVSGFSTNVIQNYASDGVEQIDANGNLALIEYSSSYNNQFIFDNADANPEIDCFNPSGWIMFNTPTLKINATSILFNGAALDTSGGLGSHNYAASHYVTTNSVGPLAYASMAGATSGQSAIFNGTNWVPGAPTATNATYATNAGTATNIYNAGAGVMSAIAVATNTNGGLLTVGTGLSANVLAGTGITVTSNSAGTITINLSGGGGSSYTYSSPLALTGTNVAFGGSTGSGTNVVLSTSPTITTPVFIGSVTTGTNLGFSDTGILQSFASSTNNYVQVVGQNLSTGTNASFGYIVGNANTTSNTYYGEFGMNGPNGAGSGAASAPNEAYLDSVTGDLFIGTLTSNPIHFSVNSSTADALTITTNEALQAGDISIVPAGMTAQTAGTITLFDSTKGFVQIMSAGSVASSVRLYSAAGTTSSPTALTSGVGFGSLQFYGYSTSSNAILSGYVTVTTHQAFSGSAAGSYLSIAATPDGGVTPTVGFCVGGDGSVTIGPAPNYNGGGALTVETGNLYFYTAGTGVEGGTTATLPNAGIVGQQASSLVSSASAISLANNTTTNVTSLSLTAGHWLVSGNVGFIGTSGTVSTAESAYVSTSNNVITQDGTDYQNNATIGTQPVTGALVSKPINITSTSTIYLNAQGIFSAGTLKAYGSITARRDQ